jgi:hypothetical protein
MWNSVEKVQSSTWREMKAIELALSSFKDQFQGKTIKCFTDNQNFIIKISKAIYSERAPEAIHQIKKNSRYFPILKIN